MSICSSLLVGFFAFLILSCKSYLYILLSYPLLDACIVNIFSQFVTRLFSSVLMSTNFYFDKIPFMIIFPCWLVSLVLSVNNF